MGITAEDATKNLQERKEREEEERKKKRAAEQALIEKGT